MTIRLTPGKGSGEPLLTNSSRTIREVARVVGKIVSSFLWVIYGPLHYRLLEHNKILALQNTC